jgi:hypothetical protein
VREKWLCLTNDWYREVRRDEAREHSPRGHVSMAEWIGGRTKRLIGTEGRGGGEERRNGRRRGGSRQGEIFILILHK